ncbi:cupin-like domain-containing protein, partial [Mariniblastus sp.]|nr:cupin-like domain-containing protein [Mariniblastus sp.]
MIQMDPNQASILNGEHPEGTLTEVQRIDSITEKQFLNDFLKTSKPVILNQGARNWKALQTWSFDYFRSFQSDCSITLEEGNVMQEATSFRTVSF